MLLNRLFEPIQTLILMQRIFFDVIESNSVSKKIEETRISITEERKRIQSVLD